MGIPGYFGGYVLSAATVRRMFWMRLIFPSQSRMFPPPTKMCYAAVPCVFLDATSCFRLSKSFFRRNPASQCRAPLPPQCPATVRSLKPCCSRIALPARLVGALSLFGVYARARRAGDDFSELELVGLVPYDMHYYTFV